MLHPEMSARLAREHREERVREAFRARRMAGATKTPPRWRRALVLRTGVALVTLGTRLEVRALRAGRSHQQAGVRRVRPVLASNKVTEWI